MGGAAIQPGRERQGGAVISGRMGCHVAVPAVFAQAQDGIRRAAKLERPGALQVLAFAVQATAEQLVQSGIVHHGRGAHPRANARVRQVDVGGIGDAGRGGGIHAGRLCGFIRPIIPGHLKFFASQSGRPGIGEPYGKRT